MEASNPTVTLHALQRSSLKLVRLHLPDRFHQTIYETVHPFVDVLVFLAAAIPKLGNRNNKSLTVVLEGIKPIFKQIPINQNALAGHEKLETLLPIDEPKGLMPFPFEFEPCSLHAIPLREESLVVIHPAERLVGLILGLVRVILRIIAVDGSILGQIADILAVLVDSRNGNCVVRSEFLGGRGLAAVMDNNDRSISVTNVADETSKVIKVHAINSISDALQSFGFGQDMGLDEFGH